ncbi:cop9 complex subunit 7a [Lichtheimia corymbifera JMRC:FSU:9682]|uniref:Cop9 complex subunit 7a n=1 Tax=Lichtheimia corymbifera JMRC:FSU:9682 TaxID=1263082 RepID=A0A068RGX5_9FUNG|nr:cop9 complex subunit 7a [Lichtheimia corymbifera JMRC:FSU:9682]
MSDLSTSYKLQPFLLLSKSVKGSANAKLISDALAAPGVYVFSELAQAPNVMEASTLPEVAPYYALLKIFLYGTYKDYTAQQQQLPQLNPTQKAKLKHLSIVSLSETNRTLQYTLLQEYLDIPNVRELEDLIIDTFYQGIIVGKLDQRSQQLIVETTMGRDVLPEQLDRTMQALEDWSTQTRLVLESIDNQIRDANETLKTNQNEREEYDNQVEQVRRSIRARKDNMEDVASSFPSDPANSNVRGRHQPMAIYGEEDASGRAKKRGVKRFMVGRP